MGLFWETAMTLAFYFKLITGQGPCKLLPSTQDSLVRGCGSDLISPVLGPVTWNLCRLSFPCQPCTWLPSLFLLLPRNLPFDSSPVLPPLTAAKATCTNLLKSHALNTIWPLKPGHASDHPYARLPQPHTLHHSMWPLLWLQRMNFMAGCT